MESQNLAEFIDPSTLECLNEEAEHTIHAIWPSSGTPPPPFFSSPESSSSVICSTSDDCEMLMKIGFRQPVKLSSIRFASAAEELQTAPKHVKLFINQAHYGFQEAGEYALMPR
eukprot:GHVQ01004767.1.p1 GENE.GHVQ01004767.1~~GHVQ01004767.1.p1  ORF type:complete len:114 (+),score=19.41 GHVQ01004767.1:333-674(+)